MLTLEQKVKILIKGIAAGSSEQAGCNDGERQMANELIKDFFRLDDKEFKEFCGKTIVRIVAYGG